MLACATTPEPRRKSDFLSDYSRLERSAETTLRWSDDDALRRYTKFLIDPAETYDHDEARSRGASVTDRHLLERYALEALCGASQDRYESSAGPDRASRGCASCSLTSTRPGRT